MTFFFVSLIHKPITNLNDTTMKIFFNRMTSDTGKDMNGDYSITPKTFLLVAPDIAQLEVNYLTFTFFGAGSVEGGKWGHLPALTNGISFIIRDFEGTILFETIFPIKTVNELSSAFTDMEYQDYSGSDYLVQAQFNLNQKIGMPAIIPPKGQIELTLSDDFSGLAGQECVAMGIERRVPLGVLAEA